LTGRFAGTFARETVHRCVLECHQLLAETARVHVYLPILAGRFARQRLSDIAKNRGAHASTTPELGV
jgi:arsenate reductase (thioredoxin)